ncbi:MAG TPA: hypothetical protein VGM43_05260 [Bryobacteraceae bacterium]
MATDSETIIDVWRGTIGVFFTAAAFAQQIVPVGKVPGGAAGFDANQHGEPLPCTVTFTKPQLNLAFRFETTYAARIPLDAYAGGEHKWRILFQVAPRGGQPVYFTDSFDVPGSSDRAFDAIVKGTFFTGEGDYDVKWSLWDDLGRVCRQNPRLEAHLTRNEQNVKAEMPPGAVGDFAWQPASQESVAAKTRRVTVLMNAALPRVKQGQSADDEWPALLTILSSLLDRAPEASVRLVVFNLDQQRELFRKDDFTTKDVAGIAHEGDAAARWAVDANVLQNPPGGWELIRKLESAEIRATPAPDMVLFLGLPAGSAEKMPDDMPQPASAQTPRFMYLSYRLDPQTSAQALRVGRGGGPSLPRGGREAMGEIILRGNPRSGYPAPDPVEQAVHRMGGRTITISSADALSKAISEVEKR